MKNLPSMVSFTFDTWTSAPGDPYLSLTAHYIDAPSDCPNSWLLKSEQLLLQEIKGRHTGKNMSEILCCAIKQYELCGKVQLTAVILSPWSHDHLIGWLVHE